LCLNLKDVRIDFPIFERGNVSLSEISSFCKYYSEFRDVLVIFELLEVSEAGPEYYFR
jgi:hypothetical protein